MRKAFDVNVPKLKPRLKGAAPAGTIDLEGQVDEAPDALRVPFTSPRAETHPSAALVMAAQAAADAAASIQAPASSPSWTPPACRTISRKVRSVGSRSAVVELTTTLVSSPGAAARSAFSPSATMTSMPWSASTRASACAPSGPGLAGWYAARLPGRWLATVNATAAASNASSTSHRTPRARPDRFDGFDGFDGLDEPDRLLTWSSPTRRAVSRRLMEHPHFPRR